MVRPLESRSLLAGVVLAFAPGACAGAPVTADTRVAPIAPVGAAATAASGRPATASASTLPAFVPTLVASPASRALPPREARYVHLRPKDWASRFSATLADGATLHVDGDGMRWLQSKDTWTVAAEPLPFAVAGVVVVPAGVVFARADGRTLTATTPLGDLVTGRDAPPGARRVNAVGAVLLADATPDALRSTDGGATWFSTRAKEDLAALARAPTQEVGSRPRAAAPLEDAIAHASGRWLGRDAYFTGSGEIDARGRLRLERTDLVSATITSTVGPFAGCPNAAYPYGLVEGWGSTLFYGGWCFGSPTVGSRGSTKVGVSLSLDGGETWSASESVPGSMGIGVRPLASESGAMVMFGPDEPYARTSKGRFRHIGPKGATSAGHPEAGGSPVAGSIAGDRFYVLIDATPDAKGRAFHLLVSTDGAATFRDRPIKLPGVAVLDDVYGVRFVEAPRPTLELYLGTNEPLWTTQDDGATWALSTSPGPGPGKPEANRLGTYGLHRLASVVGKTGDRGWAARESADGGVTWTDVWLPWRDAQAAVELPTTAGACNAKGCTFGEFVFRPWVVGAK